MTAAPCSGCGDILPQADLFEGCCADCWTTEPRALTANV
jgi:hypothetical protein